MPKAPVRYTRELTDLILERLASGETLRAICETDRFPTEAAVRKWALEDKDGFGKRFLRARRIGCFALADEHTERVKRIKTPEEAQVARVQGDWYRYYLGRIAPDVFSERPAEAPPPAAPAITFNIGVPPPAAAALPDATIIEGKAVRVDRG